jgi:hypothetical protein
MILFILSKSVSAAANHESGVTPTFSPASIQSLYHSKKQLSKVSGKKSSVAFPVGFVALISIVPSLSFKS